MIMDTITPSKIGDFKVIPVAQLHPSRSNPRKRFSEEWIDELAESIKDVGIMQPIVVRPHPQVDGEFQIVSGECRYRAALKAELEMAPTMVRQLTDAQMLKLQIIENLKRRDIHPMETAEGYDYLMKHENYTADQLAEELGVGRSTIYASLKLCELSVYGRDMFYDGKLSQSTALLIARIPGEKLQSEAIKEIIPQYAGAEGMSFREASRHVQNKYTLRLRSAPFDTTDATLVPEAGNCTDCPLRSGNNRAVYHDIESLDVCTSPDCYTEKRKAHVIRLKESGDKVISGKTAEKVWSGYGEIKGGYISPDAPFYDAPKLDGKHQTFRQVLGENLPAEAIVVRDDQNKSIKVVSEAAIATALKAAGYEVKPKEDRQAWEKQQQARRERNEQLTHARKRDFGKVHHMIQHPDVTSIMPIILFEMLPHIAASAIQNLDREAFQELRKINGQQASTLNKDEFSQELAALCPVKDQDYLIHWALEAIAYDVVIVDPWINDPKEPHPLHALIRAMCWDTRKGPKTAPTPRLAAPAKELNAKESHAEFKLESPTETPIVAIEVEVSNVAAVENPDEVKAFLEKQVDAFAPNFGPAEAAGTTALSEETPRLELGWRGVDEGGNEVVAHYPSPAAQASESTPSDAPLPGFVKAKLKGEKAAARRKAIQEKKESGQPDTDIAPADAASETTLTN
jgi:ParB/RepB/Spo0J family partition protein